MAQKVLAKRLKVSLCKACFNRDSIVLSTQNE